MSHQYHLIAETDAREIEWEYDTPRDAYRAWRQITATGRTHDTGCKVRRASLCNPTHGLRYAEGEDS